MLLLVMRHGAAAARGPAGDASRPLTATGEAEAAYIGQALAQLDAPPPKIIASPYVRANRTAEIVASYLDVPEIGHSSGLTPEADPVELLIELNGSHRGTLLLVSHMPFVARFCAHLLLGDERLQMEFRTGSVAGIEVAGLRRSGACGALRFLLQPGLVAPPAEHRRQAVAGQ